VAGRQKTEALITPTADRQPAGLGNFAAPLLRKIAAPLTLTALVAMRGSITALERGQESLRDDVGIMAAILRRVDHNQTAYRDELRQLYEMHRDLRERVETIEREPPAS
jgi:hypothetical protein